MSSLVISGLYDRIISQWMGDLDLKKECIPPAGFLFASAQRSQGFDKTT